MNLSPIDIAIGQLEDLINQYEKLPWIRGDYSTYKHDDTLLVRMLSAVERLQPSGFDYYGKIQHKGELDDAYAVAVALKKDYHDGYLKTLNEIIHADLFSDFLSSAEHLLSEGYKDAAAVIAGSVLEQHLRELSDKSNVDLVDAKGNPKKASLLNADLKVANVYGKQELQDVTSWLNLRNNAAHGHYQNYTKEQVSLMLGGIRHFIQRLPA